MVSITLVLQAAVQALTPCSPAGEDKSGLKKLLHMSKSFTIILSVIFSPPFAATVNARAPVADGWAAGFLFPVHPVNAEGLIHRHLHRHAVPGVGLDARGVRAAVAACGLARQAIVPAAAPAAPTATGVLVTRVQVHVQSVTDVRLPVALLLWGRNRREL